MNRKNRDIFETKIELLKVCMNKDQILSRISRALRANNTQVNRFLDIFISHGLIESKIIKNLQFIDGTFTVYHTTQLGVSIIPKAEEMKEIFYD